MSFAILRFQLRYQLRQTFFLFALIGSFTLAFAYMSSDRVDVFPFMSENIYRNAPIVLVRFMGMFSLPLLLLLPYIFSASIIRDTEVGIADILFSTPIRNRDYFLGHFLSGLALCSLLFFAIASGMALGLAMPWVDTSRLGPMRLWPYVWDFVILKFPNWCFLGSIMILVAMKSRSIVMVYVAQIGFIAVRAVANAYSRGLTENQWLSWLLDPTGGAAFAHATRYYVALELNTKMPSISGYLLANRLLYLGVSVALVYCAIHLFNRDHLGTVSMPVWRRLSLWKPREQSITEIPYVGHLNCPPNFGSPTSLLQMWSIFRLDCRMVFLSAPFLFVLIISTIAFYSSAGKHGEIYGTDLYPTTGILLEALNQILRPILLMLVTFYTGELVFRERQSNLAEIIDAFPIATWPVLCAKTMTMISMIVVFLFGGAIAIIARQLVDGEVPIELGVLAGGVAITSIPLIFFGLFSLALQVFCNHKYLGYFAMLVLISIQELLQQLGYNQNLYLFASLPKLIYSDLNAYGHFLIGWAWHSVYWAMFCLMLMLIANAFWPRGIALSGRTRCMAAVQNLSMVARVGLVLSFSVFVGSGGWIFYNTNRLNQFPSNEVIRETQIRYEKLFRQYDGLPQPKLTSVFSRVDIYPEERRIHIDATYTLKNLTYQPLDLIRIQTDTSALTTWHDLPPHRVLVDNKEFGFKILQLKQALTPGNSMELAFSVQVKHKGFTNEGKPDNLNFNGTFFTNADFFPHLGYDRGMELQSSLERKKAGLGLPSKMSKLEDVAARENHSFGAEADWISFETIVSTSSDQFPVAPGTLEKRWLENGRQYAHYRVASPMMPYFAYLSGRWKVKQEMWDGILIEIYYDQKHSYNIDRMLSTAKRSLDYYTKQFGSYQHKQLRIVEFPRYRQFAQSFANTIPFSEGMGFTTDLRERSNIDYVTFITAHEIAHQWWGHQVIGANVQGASMLSESLAEYSALMVMEKKYGRERMRRYLRYELDTYLRARGHEQKVELPLYKVESQQYLHYNKGSLVFYRLREEIGEDNLNRALRRYLQDKAFQDAPYTTSQELLDYIRAEAPRDKQNLITDLFEKIVIYDNSVTVAKAKQRPDGLWDVVMEVNLSKFEADSKGKQIERAFDEPIEIVIFSRPFLGTEKDESVLMMEKRLLPSNRSTIKFTVTKKPFEVGVDPYNKMIDRNSGDNRKVLEIN